MTGLMWAAAIWGGFYLIASRFRTRSRVVGDWFGREHLALLIALLGTYSIAARTEAEEVLRQPLVLERIVRGGLSAIALVVIGPMLFRRIRSYVPGRRAMTGLFVYLGVAAVSTLYSAAPLVTAAKVGELSAGLAPVVAIALGPRSAERLRHTIVLLMSLVATMLAVTVVGFVALPSVFAGVQSRPGFVLPETLISPFAHNNTLSAMGAILLVFAVAMVLVGRGGRRIWSAGAVVGVASLVLSSGRQGVVMAVAGLAVVLWAVRRTLFLGLLGPAIVGLVYVFWDSIFDALARNRPQQLTTFTGRLYWWEAAVEAWSAHPWTGWGYAAGGRFVALASIGRGATSSVHSGYVEALVGVGLLGLVGLVYALGEVIAWSIRSLKEEIAFAVLIVPLALRTAISQGFASWLNIEFVLFAILVAIADQARIERRAARRSPDAPVPTAAPGELSRV